ncbi:MAG TPA: hypothetical protein VGF55_05235 [Gemmataceae bacterium]|jgi:hypothetical protein
MTTNVSEPPQPARGEYTRRRAARERRADDLARRYERVTRAWKNVRLLITAVIWEEVNMRLHLGVLLLLGGLAALMVVLILWAARVHNARRRALRSAAYYDRRLTVLDGDWPGRGETGRRYLDPKHPCAADLDLFGDASLYELLCTARTRAGQDALAGWLLHPALPPEVRRRQAAVAALRDQLDLREDLDLIGGEVRSGDERAAFGAWAVQPTWPGLAAARGLAGVVAVFVAVAVVAACVTGRPEPILVVLSVAALTAVGLRHRVRAALAPIEPYAGAVAVYADLLTCWERAGVGAAFGPEPLRRLARLLSRLRTAPVAAPVLCLTRLALAIEVWRRRHGDRLADWLDAAGRAEALCGLATYAYENPADPFPELAEAGPSYEGEGLAHPLLPSGRCVPNDMALGGGPRLLVVSGCNMSGKSTLLRTVGVNAVLALAGAPVRATRLRLSPFAIGATLRVQDSLQRGQSRFFAEITRLRQILDLAKGEAPVLFLLDELLSGTNSEDRRAGAAAVLRKLVDAGAVGLVTTHDLALTPIADELGPAGGNVHFADRLEDGRLVFDYRMRPGVVRQRNALALMRSVGIDV